MAAAAVPRKTVSIHDYPEHLNPFREDDNHNKIRFWTLGRKSLTRSNSINFSGIKELKNSWAFRSFMRKDKKSKKQCQDKQTSQTNGDASPIVYRRALQYSSASSAVAPTSGSRITLGSPERPDRYVYGGSITPLPRSRFQERLRSPSNYEVGTLRGDATSTPRMARSELGSRLSMESTNPFEEGDPVPPVRRRKKKKAPLPPGAADISVTSTESEVIPELHIKEDQVPAVKAEEEDNLDDSTMNIELKIVEDEEINSNALDDNTPRGENIHEIEVVPMSETKPEAEIDDPPKKHHEPSVSTEEIVTSQVQKDTALDETNVKSSIIKETVRSDSEDDILNKVSFPKVNIDKYRRNSSLNEDDIRLRREHMETKAANTVRSKSLTNNIHSTHFTSYDINLNIEDEETDANHNQPQKVVCKLYDDFPRKQSVDVSISSTEKEFIEIDRATKELEREISKLNTALSVDDVDVVVGNRLSVSDIRRKFDTNGFAPNPIPKPRRSQYGSNSPINGNY